MRDQSSAPGTQLPLKMFVCTFCNPCPENIMKLLRGSKEVLCKQQRVYKWEGLLCQSRSLQAFSVKTQTVNILDFVDHTGFAKTTHLCQRSGQAATDNRYMSGNDRPPIKLYLQSRQQASARGPLCQRRVRRWGGDKAPSG